MHNRYAYKHQRYTRISQESRFATPEEVEASGTWQDLREKDYQAAGVILKTDGTSALVDDSDNHTIIFGSTASMKTRRHIFPMLNTIIKAGHSCLVVDTKGEIYDRYSGMLRRRHIKTVLLDFRNLDRGDQFNPLQIPYELYRSGEKEEAVSMVADFVQGLAQPQFDKNTDVFWPGMASSYANSICQIMLECFSKETCNVANMVNLCAENQYEAMNRFSYHIDQTSPTALSLNGFLSSAEKTRRSIEVSLYEMIRIFALNKKLMRMMSRSTFDMRTFGHRQTVVFLQIADEKPTFHVLANLVISQLYQVLIAEAQKQDNKQLPIPFDFVLDEFCNIPALPSFSNYISAARSRNIRFHLVVQSMHQLIEKYGEDAETITGNCQNWVFLASRELKLLNDISELCGNITTLDGRSRRLISVSELQRFSKEKGECLILHNRLYPYVAELPDIDEYECIERYPAKPVRKIAETEVLLIDIGKVTDRIRKKEFPMPFAAKEPAYDLAVEMYNKKNGAAKAEDNTSCGDDDTGIDPWEEMDDDTLISWMDNFDEE